MLGERYRQDQSHPEGDADNQLKNRGHENAERKEKITQRVFDQQAKTKLVIDFYVVNM